MATEKGYYVDDKVPFLMWTPSEIDSFGSHGFSMLNGSHASPALSLCLLTRRKRKSSKLTVTSSSRTSRLDPRMKMGTYNVHFPFVIGPQNLAT